MKARIVSAIFGWSAGFLIGIIPLLCHFMVVATRGVPDHESTRWAVDVVFVAISTSGLSAVTLFTRFYKGEIKYQQLRPYTILLLACNMVTFLMSGVLFGQISDSPSGNIGLLMPTCFLVFASASSLYFEILLAIEELPVRRDD